MADNELQVSNEPSGMLHETKMCTDLAEEYGLHAKQVINVLRSIVKVPKGDKPATPAELVVVLSVMRQYNMNPMMKQLHVWRDNRGDLAIMPGYDFWTQKANEQPGFLRVSYEYGPEVPSPDDKGKSCWEWVKATVHDSIRGDMEMFPVYLEEWYQPQTRYPGPWQKQTRHKMHVIAYRLAIREAYGIGLDIRDPGDFAVKDVNPGAATTAKLDGMAAQMDEDAPYTDVTPEPANEPDEPAEVTRVPCGAAGCMSEGSGVCEGCGVYFCPDHLDKDNKCAICGLGGE